MITIEGPDITEDHTSLFQLRDTLRTWIQTDKLHGRSVGRNGFRDLPPPGNGHGRRPKMSDSIVFVESDMQKVYTFNTNPFAEAISSNLKQSVDYDGANEFLTTFRHGVELHEMPQTHTNDFSENLYLDLLVASFSNDFAKACTPEEPKSNERSQQKPMVWVTPPDAEVHLHDRPRITVLLDHLVPEEPSPRKVPFDISDKPHFLDQPWHCPPFELPASLDHKPCFLKWLGLHTPSDNHTALFIYTDGSFQTSLDRASWALVVCTGPSADAPVDEQTPIAWLAGLVQNDSLHDQYVGAAWNDAVTAEASALIWAGLYALAHADMTSITFCYDALGVGQAAAGTFNYKEYYDIVHNARYIMQAVESRWGIGNVFYQHVKGHQGHPANELADTLAFETVRLWLVPQHPELPLRQLFMDKSHLMNLWIQSMPRLGNHWPSFTQDGFCGPARSQLLPLQADQDWTFQYGQLRHHAQELELRLDLYVHSHNVQSLKGKIMYYRAQLHHCRVPLVGLQETANPEARVTRADGYMRLVGPAEHGHGGVEIWLAENYPIAWKKNKPVYWNLAGTTVLYYDSRLLLVVATIPELGQVLLLSGHAPHSGADVAVQDSWWAKLRTLLRQHQRGRPLIAMLDANAHTGSTTSAAIGSHCADEENHNGELFRSFMEDTATWAPSTFFHIGDSRTWHGNASRSHDGRRLDYIVIANDFASLYVTSMSAPDIDVGHKTVDHTAVQLRLQGPVAGKGPRSLCQDGVDWKAVRMEKSESTWRTILSSLPDFDWQLDPHRHWQEAHQALISALRHYYPLQVRRPKRAYISDAAWTLRRSRNYHKTLWRDGATEAVAYFKLAAIKAWRNAVGLHHWLAEAKRYSLLTTLRSIIAGSTVADLSIQLKKQIKEDKKEFLMQVAAEARADKANAYQILRRVGFGSKRKMHMTPLPCILKADGLPCESTSEIQATWLHHFAEVEGGHEIPKEAMPQICAATELAMPDNHALTWSEMPTLADVEQALRKAGLHKEAGPDKIVPEICHRAAKFLARWLYPLFAKAVFYNTEPLQFKGGILHSIWKHKGPQSLPESYRGILVSSQLAKALHAVFRKRALNTFVHNAASLQCGGYPGRSVSQAACLQTASEPVQTTGLFDSSPLCRHPQRVLQTTS